MSNNTNPATYGDTRSAKEIAQGQIQSALTILAYQRTHGEMTHAEYKQRSAALYNEAAKRGVQVSI